MTDILCISTTDWNEIWGSRQQIMSRLAEAGHRVLFVERQVGPEHLWRDPSLRERKRAAGRQPALRQAAERLWLWQPPLLPPGRYFSQALNAAGQRRLARGLQPVLEELGFRKPLLWLYPPQSAPLIGRFGEQLSIYHCIDRFVGGQAGRKRQVMLAQEQALLKQADLVFVHSEGLRRLYAPLTRRPVTLVSSAADVAHFQSTSEIHPDVAAIPSPRLGVSGTLDGRFDVPLLLAVVRKNPSWHLVLVGQVRPGRVDLRPLLDCPNVHSLGQRPFSELPALLNGMDVLLVPYVRDELTEFISPIKVYEYLATGKPIVSTALPEVLPLQPWVDIAGDQGRFLAAIRRALSEDDPSRQQARRQAAWEHTWDARVRLMWEKVTEALEVGRAAG